MHFTENYHEKYRQTYVHTHTHARTHARTRVKHADGYCTKTHCAARRWLRDKKRTMPVISADAEPHDHNTLFLGERFYVSQGRYVTGTCMVCVSQSRCVTGPLYHRAVVSQADCMVCVSQGRCVTGTLYGLCVTGPLCHRQTVWSVCHRALLSQRSKSLV